MLVGLFFRFGVGGKPNNKKAEISVDFFCRVRGRCAIIRQRLVLGHLYVCGKIETKHNVFVHA
jgi:hypothetical protein